MGPRYRPHKANHYPMMALGKLVKLLLIGDYSAILRLSPLPMNMKESS
ncbi:hypothetical protein ACO0KY_07475 [Undibacterium sp. Dicai25W]